MFDIHIESALIAKAQSYLKLITEPEHDINHTYDVIENINRLCINMYFSPDAIRITLLSGWWHDVGRLYMDKDHEILSAQMLFNELRLNCVDVNTINRCVNAIVNHKWDSPKPLIPEGVVLRDADKLAWIGLGRLAACVKNNTPLDTIIELLPKLRDEILITRPAQRLFDTDIIKAYAFLHNHYMNNREEANT